MSWSEISTKSASELNRQLAAMREQLRSARFRVSQGQLKDVRQVRSLRRDIARYQTKLQQLSVSPKKS